MPAEQLETLMQWFAFVSLLQLKLHWTQWSFLCFLLEQGKHHTSLVTPTTHVHRDLGTTFHVTTQHWGKQRHSVTSLVCRSLVACWTAGNSDAVVCCYRPFPWNLRWTPWNFPWFYAGASNTTSETFAPCSMSRHNTVENSTLHWGPFFWFAKSCPSGLLCVENPQAKGQQGGNSPFSYVAQRSYGRCGGRVHGRMNLYLLSVWDPANPRTGLPFIMSCHAFSRVGNKVIQGHVAYMVATCHDSFHLISFHPLPSGCIQVCACGFAIILPKRGVEQCFTSPLHLRQGFGNSTVLAHFDGELPSLHCLLQGHRVMSMVAQKKIQNLNGENDWL